MALISLQNIRIGFAHPLLDDISINIESGEHICLLGRNGCGKTTLMKMIAGEIQPDSGLISLRQGARIAYLTQDIPQTIQETVRELLNGALGRQETVLEDYVVERMIRELKLPGEELFSSLSSGQKRRALLARVLLAQPDLLMLDEPTNHLDIESIAWLDGFLHDYPKAVLLVTHDRQLVRRVAGRIIEIDLGRLFDWNCDYETFLIRKEQALTAEDEQNRRFDKKLSQEEAWIRQGIKARRTRNEGRVRALEAMREKRRRRRPAPGQVNMVLQEAGRSGELVLQAERLNYQYGENKLIVDFSTTVMRRDRIGIIGANGCGKSTLIRLLLGEIQPLSGQLTHGSSLSIIYYDQQRQQLDEDKTVWENIAGGNDHIRINGTTQHVVGYLQRFLFSPERMRVPVGVLSGGERGRLLLARLFTQPCNLLVMDEPTNDLDLETLELLEELLLEFKGTLLVISHDRAFLNNVVTSTLVFEGDGRINEYIGGYDDWLRQRPTMPPAMAVEKTPALRRVRQASKLSNREERLLSDLPEQIEALEQKKALLLEAMSQSDFYRKEPGEVLQANSSLQNLQFEIAAAYACWQELEDKRSALQAQKVEKNGS